MNGRYTKYIQCLCIISALTTSDLLARRAGKNNVVQKVGEENFLINADLFAQRVKNLAHFIDMFDITTVYNDGTSIGCRFGKLKNKALARSMGLKSGDIVTNINGIPTTTANHVTIYKKITSMNNNDTVNLTVQRNNQEIMLHYTLQNFRPEKEVSAIAAQVLAQQVLTSEVLRQKQGQLYPVTPITE